MDELEEVKEERIIVENLALDESVHARSFMSTGGWRVG